MSFYQGCSKHDPDPSINMDVTQIHMYAYWKHASNKFLVENDSTGHERLNKSEQN